MFEITLTDVVQFDTFSDGCPDNETDENMNRIDHAPRRSEPYLKGIIVIEVIRYYSQAWSVTKHQYVKLDGCKT